MIPDRLQFLFRRFRIAKKSRSRGISILSYCNKSCSFESQNEVKRFSELYDSHLGRWTYVAESTRIRNTTIGHFCSIGPHCIIGELARHPTDWFSTHPITYSNHFNGGETFFKRSEFQEYVAVTIASDVFVGARAMIFPGVRIGVGAIVAAGAVVTKNVEDYSIVAGVPARSIRKRFDESTVAELLNSKWWSWSDDAIRKFAQTLGDNKPDMISLLRKGKTSN